MGSIAKREDSDYEDSRQVEGSRMWREAGQYDSIQTKVAAGPMQRLRFIGLAQTIQSVLNSVELNPCSKNFLIEFIGVLLRLLRIWFLSELPP